jgi:hypothetical protein
MTAVEPIQLPRSWTKTVRSSVVHAVAVASVALTRAWGSAARSQRQVQVVAELDRARAEIALLREELNIKDVRWSRVPPRRRPHYTPVQRMRILQLKAARGWSSEEAARVFMIDEQTLQAWLRRVDEGGEGALVQVHEPVHKFPRLRALSRQATEDPVPHDGEDSHRSSPGTSRFASRCNDGRTHLEGNGTGARGRGRCARRHRNAARYGQAPRRCLARGSHDRSHGGRLLGTVAPVRHAAIVAALLVGRCRR